VSEPRLCYVSDGLAYFTTRPVTEQWGDDWNDAPYEHNAGLPYAWREDTGRGCRCYHPNGFTSYRGGGKCGERRHDAVPPEPEWMILTVGYHGALHTPDHGRINSAYSVRDINQRDVPWLQTDEDAPRRVRIWAGATIPAFKAAVRLAGGNLFCEVAA
jgi:hypothetical protein